jgi:hypothetical protein
MTILEEIEKYNNYNTKYLECIIDFTNSFNLENKINNFLYIICTNIRSVKANFDQLILLLENDRLLKKIDNLILTETWHNMADCVYTYTISGYNTYFSTVKRNQNDGLIIFVNENLTIDLYEYGFEKVIF